MELVELELMKGQGGVLSHEVGAIHAQHGGGVRGDEVPHFGGRGDEVPLLGGQGGRSPH